MRVIIDTDPVLSYIRVMKNITITMPEDLAKRVRVLAAEADTSMSQYLCGLAARATEELDTYQKSMGRYFSRKRGGLKLAGQKLPSRDELYDRDALR